ncbi:hypothetical protein Golob_013140, partial [Gossypium lobatum]|nr:hypothetical protein [Gossypium lobatum]
YLKELDGLNNQLPGSRLLTDRWISPISSINKINFDAAFNRQRKESCLGLVVQNEKVEAIHLGLNLGLRALEIEGDAYTVIATEGLRRRETTYLNEVDTSHKGPTQAQEYNGLKLPQGPITRS